MQILAIQTNIHHKLSPIIVMSQLGFYAFSIVCSPLLLLGESYGNCLATFLLTYHHCVTDSVFLFVFCPPTTSLFWEKGWDKCGKVGVFLLMGYWLYLQGFGYCLGVWGGWFKYGLFGLGWVKWVVAKL